MPSIELAALRKRARAAGIAPGVVARAQRAKEAHQAEWHASCPWPFRPPPPARLVDPSPIDFEGVSRWVVAVTKSSMARSVSEDLPALGFRAYCPLGRRMLFRARGPGGKRYRRVHQWAVFGRYLFVGEMLEPLAASIHEGIVDVIGDSRGAWPLSPTIVQAINEAELNGEWDFVGSSENPFKVGQSVRVAEGHPFEHFVGVVTALLHGGAWINLDVFGRPTPVSVPVRKLVAAL
jgi:transcription antitermination factor NusG